MAFWAAYWKPFTYTFYQDSSSACNLMEYKRSAVWLQGLRDVPGKSRLASLYSINIIHSFTHSVEHICILANYMIQLFFPYSDW